MDMSENIRESDALQNWYRYAAKQPWAVDAYLKLVREHEFKTQEQQRNEFGVTPEEFLHLQGMRLPRVESFVFDARRIAKACHLENPNAFVQAMLLGRQLAQAEQSPATPETFYQAAFDADENLDEESDTQ